MLSTDHDSEFYVRQISAICETESLAVLKIVAFQYNIYLDESVNKKQVKIGKNRKWALTFASRSGSKELAVCACSSV